MSDDEIDDVINDVCRLLNVNECVEKVLEVIMVDEYARTMAVARGGAGMLMMNGGK